MITLNKPVGPSNPSFVPFSPCLQHLRVTFRVDFGCNTISYNICLHRLRISGKKFILQMIIMMRFWCLK